ncbi:major capsid hexamer protein [Mycobacterium phage Bassalto]|nr:major capsid hexamer protein [Mycobacterium phage Bassalto]
MDPFELPEDLSAIATTAELTELRDQAQAEITVLTARHAAKEKLSPEDVKRLEYLLDSVDKINPVIAERQAEEGKHAADLDSLISRATKKPEPEAPADNAPEAGPEDEDEGDDDGGDTADDAADESADEKDPALVAAGKNGKRPIQFKGGDDAPPAGSPTGNSPAWEMLPSAPGYVEGPVGFREIALGIDSVKVGSRSGLQPTGTRGRFATQALARLKREVTPVNDSHALVAAIEKATSEVPGHGKVDAKALTAAGGWCAPSEQLYDFCDVPEPTDLISLPEITVNRGGIRWPVEPDVSELLTNYAFQFYFTETQLEAEDGDGNPTAVKELIEIPCPDEFQELRLNAIGYGVKAGILQDQGWPELTEWFLRTFAGAHLRGVSWRTINDMVAGSGSPILFNAANSIGAVSSFLNSLALAATNLRVKRGLRRDATIEGVAPSWIHEVIRADLAMMEGKDTKAVSDAEITGWLTARNIYLQYVADWQSRGAGQPGNLNTTQWPGTVNVLLYPAGTWFRAMNPVITLGTMYPLEQLVLNRFTRFFTEDAIMVGKRCNDSINVQIPICANGAIGARESITCPSFDPGDNTFSLTITATGGQYKLKSETLDASTADIAYNADNATIKAALVALDDGFKAADFDVTGTSPKSIKAPKELGTITAVDGTTPPSGGTVTVA